MKLCFLLTISLFFILAIFNAQDDYAKSKHKKNKSHSSKKHKAKSKQKPVKETPSTEFRDDSSASIDEKSIINESLNTQDDTIITVPKKGFAIKINKLEYTLYLFYNSKPIKSYKVAIGKNTGDKQKVGDCRTPEGRFRISEAQNAKKWKHDFKDDGHGEIPYAYGPYFLRLETNQNGTFSKDTWTGIGIHGTTDKNIFDLENNIICGPKSIGMNISEGCIRMHNKELQELVKTIVSKKNRKLKDMEGIPVIIVDGNKRK